MIDGYSSGVWGVIIYSGMDVEKVWFESGLVVYFDLYSGVEIFKNE